MLPLQQVRQQHLHVQLQVQDRVTAMFLCELQSTGHISVIDTAASLDTLWLMFAVAMTMHRYEDNAGQQL